MEVTVFIVMPAILLPRIGSQGFEVFILRIEKVADNLVVDFTHGDAQEVVLPESHELERIDDTEQRDARARVGSIIVCVFPELVWPYAMMVPLIPPMQASQWVCRSWWTSSVVAELIKQLPALNLNFGLLPCPESRAPSLSHPHSGSAFRAFSFAFERPQANRHGNGPRLFFILCILFFFACCLLAFVFVFAIFFFLFIYLNVSKNKKVAGKKHGKTKD